MLSAFPFLNLYSLPTVLLAVLLQREYTLSIDDVRTSLKLLLQQNRACGVGGGGVVKRGKGGDGVAKCEVFCEAES